MNMLDRLMKRLNNETNASYKIRKEGLRITIDINTFVQGIYLERLLPLVMSNQINILITNKNDISQAIINILKNETETVKYMNDHITDGINEKNISPNLKKIFSSTRTAIKSSWLLGKQTNDLVSLGIDQTGMITNNYQLNINDSFAKLSSEDLLKFYYEAVPRTHKVKR